MTDEATRELSRKLDQLETTVRRAVEELKSLRAQWDTAQAEAQRLRAALQERSRALQQLETQLRELEGERDEVRRRVELLVAQIDSLSEVEP